MNKYQRKVLLALIVIAIGLLVASCMSPQVSKAELTTKVSNIDRVKKMFGEIINGVIYGETRGYEYYEHRILIGYEDRKAVDEVVKEINGQIYKEIPEIKVVAVKTSMTVEKVMAKLKLKKWKGIRYIEPSYKRDLIDPNPGKYNNLVTRAYGDYPDVDEELWRELWGMQVVNAPEAWKEATGTGVVVAVVDTPIDCQHPDLLGQCVTGYDPEMGYEIPPDTDYEDPNNPEDDHGTHVAGTIAAKKDGKGVVGLAYGAKIMPILIFRGYYDNGKPSYYYIGDEYVAAGIIWAVDHGADVLSNSWGGPGYSYTLKAAIDYALSHGAVFVAAAGNGHTDQHWHYPSAYPGVIAVAASTARDEIIDFSNRGDYVSVAAPGVNVLSTVPHLGGYGIKAYDGKGRYDYWGGTSMATPHVSALAALLKQKYPNATPYQIKKMIEHSAADIDDLGWDHAAGYGRIDAAKAIKENPMGYKGARYHIYVDSKDLNLGIPGVLITLKRKSGVGPDYYAATDDMGIASFYGIDPDDYDVIIGGPDLFEMNSPSFRMEEQTGVTYSESIPASEVFRKVAFDTKEVFKFHMKPGDTVYIYEFMNEQIVSHHAYAEEVFEYTNDGGIVAFIYQLPYYTENPEIDATAIVNGQPIRLIPLDIEADIGYDTLVLLGDQNGLLPYWVAF